MRTFLPIKRLHFRCPKIVDYGYTNVVNRIDRTIHYTIVQAKSDVLTIFQT
jgi:hypothetical protein